MMNKKTSKPEYLAQVQLLTKEETERLLSRMAGKLPRQLKKDKLTQDEALAIQMELEDEQLQEWREKMHSLREKELATALEKDKEPKKNKIAEKTEATEEAKAPAKSKATEKIKVAKKE
jgi:hypothetical protein